MLKILKIYTHSDNEYAIMNAIHSSLVGNDDYIDCSIVVNDSSTRCDGTFNVVHVIVNEDNCALLAMDLFMGIVDMLDNNDYKFTWDYKEEYDEEGDK